MLNCSDHMMMCIKHGKLKEYSGFLVYESSFYYKLGEEQLFDDNP